MKSRRVLFCLLSACAVLGCSPTGTATHPTAGQPDGQTPAASEGKPSPRHYAQIHSREWSESMNENNHQFTCPENQAIVGHRRSGVLLGRSMYECALFRQVNGAVKMLDTREYGPFPDAEWRCPSGRVLVGRSHHGDGFTGENFYRCAIPVRTLWDDPMQVVSHGWTIFPGEFVIIADCADEFPGVMIGRGRTSMSSLRYECGTMW